MKKLIPIFALAILALSFTGGEITTLKVGDAMPKGDISMEATDGKSYSLDNLKKENGLLVIFSCNTCPFVVGGKTAEGWEGRYNEVYEAASDNKIGMVLVNSNAAKRDNGDSMKDMKKRAKKEGLKATYVIDNNSELADSFGARTTPHVFLFNADGKVVYAGAIDDNVDKASEVKSPWLKNALDAAGKGEKIDPAQTKNKGCSIKRSK
mgnify:CR=1 FL=1